MQYSMVHPIIVITTLLLSTTLIAGSDNEEEAPMDHTVRFGFWLPILSDINPNDAKIVTKVWLESWGKNSGAFDTTETELYTNFATLRNAFRNGEIHMGMVHTMDYFNLESDHIVTSAFSYVRSTGIGEAYVLLVHQDSLYGELADLRGKTIMTKKSGWDMITHLWIDTLLLEQGLPTAERFFAKVSFKVKPSQSLLPLFFRQTDACIVTKAEFDVMAELNPQVGQMLRIIAQTTQMPPIIMCFSTSAQARKRKFVIETIPNVHKHAHVQQIFTIHRVDRLSMVTPEDLAPVRLLSERYQRACEQTGVAPVLLRGEP